MLVLSRKAGESIVIDGRIQVMVKQVSGNRVRLVIQAPEDILVDRQEVWLRRQKERKHAAAWCPK